jgi:hypothetical protein
MPIDSRDWFSGEPGPGIAIVKRLPLSAVGLRSRVPEVHFSLCEADPIVVRSPGLRLSNRLVRPAYTAGKSGLERRRYMSFSRCAARASACFGNRPLGYRRRRSRIRRYILDLRHGRYSRARARRLTGAHFPPPVTPPPLSPETQMLNLETIAAKT